MDRLSGQTRVCSPGAEIFSSVRSFFFLLLSVFLVGGCLTQVDSSCLGVESLTKRLVSLLTVRIKDALPNMKWELQESLSKFTVVFLVSCRNASLVMVPWPRERCGELNYCLSTLVYISLCGEGERCF